MPLFVTSTSSVIRHGVFAIKKTPQTQIRAIGTGVVGMVAQFPWGPKATLEAPADIAAAKKLFAPAGMARTGSGYLMLHALAWPAGSLRIVRVLGSDSAVATATLTDSPTNILTVPGKWHGVAGNSLVATVAAATDGDANHFNLTATITGASGTTTDKLENYNVSGVGSDTVLTQAQLNQLQLIGAPVKLNAGRPDNGTYSFTGGTDGTINSGAYLGTPGTGNLGVAKLEADDAIFHVVTDYPGSGLIAAVNAGLVAHRVARQDRFVYLNGIPAQSLSAVQTDVASYRGIGVVYADPWPFVYDETTGAETLVAPAAFAASVAAQLPPSTAFAWKNTVVKQMLSSIVRLETDRGDGAGSNTLAGICTLIREVTGGHTFEAAVNTIAPADPANRRTTTTGMDMYIAKSFTISVRGTVDAPNVEVNRQDLAVALDAFMDPLKRNATTNPNFAPHVVDFQIPPLDANNTPETIQAGEVYVPLNVQYSSGAEKIFLVVSSGEGPIQFVEQ